MFDTISFLKAYFPTPQNVLGLFRAYGVEQPSQAAVEKWYQRGSVSGTFFPMLLCLLELERGAPVSLAAFLQGGPTGK
ncbi:MAG: hypothetical protein E6R08_09865 [Nevskiaceae bacterium]|nr:MAG: hypothetical protein E6R08_09865 [Nevskiaceae bacterium]